MDDKITFDKKNPPLELHVKDAGTFYIVDKKLYYLDGRPVEPGKVWLCPHCDDIFVTTKEILFAKHMVTAHPEQTKKTDKKR